MNQASNVARLFADGTPANTANPDLPSPFNVAQVEGMTKDLTRALKELPAGASEADATAVVIHTVAVWTARAARHYAWARDCEVREDVGNLHGAIVQKVEELTTQCMLLEGRLHLLERGGLPGPSH